jgi:hypothetical protein
MKREETEFGGRIRNKKKNSKCGIHPKLYEGVVLEIFNLYHNFI